MAFWNRRKTEERTTLKNPNQAFVRGLGLETASPTGKNVTVESAIGGTIAVYAAVGILSDSVSTLPLFAYRTNEEDGREKLPRDHPLQRLVHTPNEEMTSQEFYEALMTHMCLWGNAYALIDRDSRGRPTALWPLDPSRMTSVFFDRDGNLVDAPDPRSTVGLHRVYVYRTKSGDQVGIPREQILHARALATDGYTGLSPIAVARTAVAIEQAASEFGARFFGNGAVPGGVLSIPEQRRNLTAEDKTRIRREWNATQGGLSNAHRVAILEGGVTYTSVGMPMEDAEFIATRRFQVSEIARLYRIPPHLLQDVDKSTSWGTGIEQQTLGFLKFTLRPWLERIEQAMDRDLGAGRGGPRLRDQGVFVEFGVEGLLRADTKARWESYEIAMRIMGMVPDEVRRLENMPPLPDGLGQRPFVPVNMGPPNEAPGGTVVIDDDGNVTGGQGVTA